MNHRVGDDTKGYKYLVMIGDGVTDLQAKPPAKLFIGYGGCVKRKAVAAEADMFVLDFSELIDVLENK